MWGTEAPLGSGTIVRAAERPVLTRAELIRKLVDERLGRLDPAERSASEVESPA